MFSSLGGLPKIKYGTKGTDGTTNSITVTFDEPFTEVPNVVATALASGGSIICTIDAVTTTQATIKFWTPEGQQRKDATASWIAVGK